MTQDINATLKDIVIEVDDGMVRYYQSLSSAQGKEPTSVKFVSGQIAYAPEDQAARLGEHGEQVSTGARITIKTYMPASSIRKLMRFDEVAVTVNRDPDDMRVRLTCIDPRKSCEIAHTCEFNEKAYAALHSICGDPRPSPCETCECPDKKRKELSINGPLSWG